MNKTKKTFIVTPMYIRLIIPAIISFLFAHPDPLTAQDFSRSYQFISSHSYVQDKNFYLFTLLEREPSVAAIISNDSSLQRIKSNRLKLLKQAAADCNEDVDCHVNHLQWNAGDVEEVAGILVRLCKKHSAIRQLVTRHMRPCGYYQHYKDSSDEALLRTAWTDAAAAMNLIMRTYALGLKSAYPAIDSASYDVSSFTYRRNINIVTMVMDELSYKLQQFYHPALSFSLQLLDINMRNEAERFEPLMETNKKVLAILPLIKWSSFSYNAILVPGAGPDIVSAAIDPWAKSRLQVAADRFRKGLAPLIIVSGGFVKPFQTPFCEGLEMKKYLMSECGIPEKYILLEPFARHTTTNIRNAVRLMVRYNIPVTKQTLVISDMYQTKTMQSEPFSQRCTTELGYHPFVELHAIGRFETAFLASVTSLHVNSSDPLDP